MPIKFSPTLCAVVIAGTALAGCSTIGNMTSSIFGGDETQQSSTTMTPEATTQPSAGTPANMSAEDMFLQDREAVWVTAICEDKTFTTDEASKLFAASERRTNHGVDLYDNGLRLDYKAKSNAQDLVNGYGCNTGRVAELRTLYQNELAPALSS